MDLEELGSCLVFGAVSVVRHAVPGQGVHGQLIQGSAGRWHSFQVGHRRVLPRRLCRMGTGLRCPLAVAEAGYSGVRGRGREGADEFSPRSPANLLVFLDVDVDGDDGDCFGHDEGQGAKVEGPSVGVGVLLVIITFVVGIPCVAGYVNDDANYVAKT